MSLVTYACPWRCVCCVCASQAQKCRLRLWAGGCGGSEHPAVRAERGWADPAERESLAPAREHCSLPPPYIHTAFKESPGPCSCFAFLIASSCPPLFFCTCHAVLFSRPRAAFCHEAPAKFPGAAQHPLAPTAGSAASALAGLPSRQGRDPGACCEEPLLFLHGGKKGVEMRYVSVVEPEAWDGVTSSPWDCTIESSEKSCIKHKNNSSKASGESTWLFP